MNKTWFSSDRHFGHAKIVEICDRPYADLHEMEEDYISKHNAVIRDCDDYWDLGDVSYKCSAVYAMERIRRLKGRIHVVLGNHDKALRQAVKRGLADDLIESGKLEIVGGKESLDNSIISAKILNINGSRLILSHYAYRTWPSAFRGTIHLFGHSHGNLKPHYKSFDIGVDGNDGCPWELSEVLDWASKVKKDFGEGE